MELTANDRLEIQELAARYAQTLDLKDGAGWAECFTEDGIFEPPGPRKFVGRQELQAFVERHPMWDSMPKVPAFQHRNHTFIIEPSSDGALMKSYFSVEAFLAEPVTVQIGRYEDRLVQVAGRWKFAHRRGTFDFLAQP
jgi:hypothetical protein